MLAARSRLTTVAVASAIALTVTACSSSGSAKDSSGPPTTTAAGTSTAVAAVQASASLLPADIRSRGYVTIATDPTYPPLESADTESGELKGMEIDLGNKLAADLGLKVKWTKVAFNSIVPGLQAGRYDLALSGFWVFPDRVKVVSMITYFKSGSQYMVKTGDKLTVNARQDLCGQTVALESGSSEISMDEDESKKCVAAGKKAITVQTYQTQDQANLAVTSGRAATTGVGAEVAGYTVKTFKGLALAGGIFDSSPAGVAFPKNSPLLKAYQAAFNDLKTNGSLAALFRTYGITDQQIAVSINQ